VDALVWAPRMYYYLTPEHKGLPPEWFFGAVIVRDAFVVLLCVLVVRSVLRPETDPVRSDGVSADDPDWPSMPAALTGGDTARNRIRSEGVRSGVS
jgi:hypothetical protein